MMSLTKGQEKREQGGPPNKCPKRIEREEPLSSHPETAVEGGRRFKSPQG
jgi:hypothetical protein